MNEGWLKLWRKSLGSAVFADPYLWHLYTWLLMRASHRERWIPVKTGRGQTQVHVLPGQLVFGRLSAADELHQPASTVWRRMLRLKELGCIELQTDSHSSIVTIVNWGTYQAEGDKSGQASDRQVTGNGQATDTQVAGNGQASDTNKNVENAQERAEGQDRVDHLELVKEDWEAIREFCRQRFVGTFGKGLTSGDRELLLKIGALVHRGVMPESWVAGALQAIAHHNGPIENRAAYMTSVLKDSARAAGRDLSAMLAAVDVPAALVAPRMPAGAAA